MSTLIYDYTIGPIQDHFRTPHSMAASLIAISAAAAFALSAAATPRAKLTVFKSFDDDAVVAGRNWTLVYKLYNLGDLCVALFPPSPSLTVTRSDAKDVHVVDSFDAEWFQVVVGALDFKFDSVAA